MNTIFSIGPFVLVGALLFSAIESLFLESFSRFTFALCIPLFRRTVDTGRTVFSFSSDPEIDLTDGQIWFTEDYTVFFRTYNDKAGFPSSPVVPVRVIGKLTPDYKLKATGKVPFGIAVFMLSITILAVTALVRDGLSPALVLLIAFWGIFLYNYYKEKKRLDNMFWELEQIIQRMKRGSGV